MCHKTCLPHQQGGLCHPIDAAAWPLAPGEIEVSAKRHKGMGRVARGHEGGISGQEEGLAWEETGTGKGYDGSLKLDVIVKIHTIFKNQHPKFI